MSFSWGRLVRFQPQASGKMVALGLVLNPAVWIGRDPRRAVMGEVKLAIPSVYEEIVLVVDAYFSSLGLKDLKKKSSGSVSGRIWFS